MSGPVALHGGAEFQSGDEPFLAALLDAAAPAAGGDRPIRVAVVPTAAGRGRPDLAAATGVAAFERVAAGRGIDVAAAAIGVLNHATASDPELAAWLAAADVIHFPGGDPDLIPTVMPGTAAWAAITDAHVGGAVLAGASAGRDGLRVVDLDTRRRDGRARWSCADSSSCRTSIRRPGRPRSSASRPGRPRASARSGCPRRPASSRSRSPQGSETIRWRVVGPGEARWLSVPDGQTVTARSGEVIETPVIPV